MIEIIPPDATFRKVIGEQKLADGKACRLLTYCVLQEVEDGFLLHNVMTREMVLLTREEKSTILANPYLRDNWFVVPCDTDDKRLVRQLRQMYQLLSPSPKGYSSFTIMPTTDCNARCFYCYEKGRSRIPMSVDTAHKVAKYIETNYRELLKDNSKAKVKLAWFGGEPLYNYEAINQICEELSEQGVEFASTMISNAYLFDEHVIELAANTWRLKTIQVTLDGTEQIYNKSKAYIYKDSNAYVRVMRNIGLLLDAGILVNVRMNMDKHNADDLMSLAEELSSRFAGYKNLHCYSHTLFELAGNKPTLRSNESRKVLYQQQQRLQNLLEEKGFSFSPRYQKSFITNRCMADSNTSVVIAPTGDIGLCEHFSESEFFSHINNPERKDNAVIASFREVSDDLPQCDSCAYYPRCIRLKKCTEAQLCFPEIQQDNLNGTIKAMVAAYESWKQHSQQNEDDNEFIAEC